MIGPSSPRGELIARWFEWKLGTPKQAEKLKPNRLTNGFSKKLENHEHAVGLYFMSYTSAGFIRHCALRLPWKQTCLTMFGLLRK